MATMTESKDAVLRVMRGEKPEDVLDSMLETPEDPDDQERDPTIEDYGPEELEQMAQAASDALVKMEAVYGNMLKHDRGSAEGCEECMEELRTAAERCQTDPIEGAIDMHKAMSEMCDNMGENAYEGSDDDTSDVQTVMGEMSDVYEEFNIKLGGSSPEAPADADGETTPGQPGGGVKVDVSGIPAGKGRKNEDDDEDDDDTAYLDDPGDDDEEEPVEADPDDDEPPEDEMGGEDEPDDEEEVNGDVPPDASADVDGDGEGDDAGSDCPVCGQQMEYSEEAGMDQCGECGYEAAANMDEPPMDDEPADDEEEPEPEVEQDDEPADDDEPPADDDDDEEEPAMEARKCPHCRQPMTEDKQRGKNVCSFCKFELDLGA